MVELKQVLSLKQTLQLVMTPQLQQAIKLLQLSRLELSETINAEMLENPVLEEEVEPDAADLPAASAESPPRPTRTSFQNSAPPYGLAAVYLSGCSCAMRDHAPSSSRV